MVFHSRYLERSSVHCVHLYRQVYWYDGLVEPPPTVESARSNIRAHNEQGNVRNNASVQW